MYNNKSILKKILIRSSAFLLLWVSINVVQAQERVVSGTITSAEDGLALPGANVIIKGTSQGTVTDYDGNYSLNVPEGATTLVFSYIGYTQQDVEILNRTVIDLQLSINTATLDDIVVTALGLERESKGLGYSVQELQGKDITEARDVNVVNSLAGKVAGVQVVEGSSGVGSTSYITVRGESSLIPGNNSPLFVVDGIPISNRTLANRSEGNLEVDYGNGAMDLNPDDIESMSVLKGANATALYGSRGANGVIVITTKSGKGTKGIGVSVNSTTSLEKPLRIPRYQNAYGQGAGGEFRFGDGFGGGLNDNIDESWGPKMDYIVRQEDLDANGQMFGVPQTVGSLLVLPQHDSPTSNGFRGGDSHPSIDRGDITSTPWISNSSNIDDFFETGTTFTNNVALTGSNEQGNFRLSYTDMRNKGILPNTDYNRGTLSLNAGYNLARNLNVSASMSYIDAESENRPNNSYGTENIMYLWVWFGRQIDMNSLRDYWQPGLEGVQQYNYNYNWHDNPYFTMYENTNGFNKDRLIGNISLNWDISEKFSLMLRTGTDYFNEERVAKRAFSTQRFPRGQYREDNIYHKEVNSDLILSYNTQLSSDWNLSASVGGNIRNEEDKYQRMSANELSIPGVYNFENARIPLAKTHFDSRKRLYSAYGFANISFRDFVFMDVTGRNDWSSTLPTSNNSYFYPSVSVSGIISEMVDFGSAISFLKLRAGWAKVGNDTDPYQLRNVYNFQEPFGTYQKVSESSTIKNSELKPETATSIEVGLDLRFFEDRLGFDFTYYKSNSKNQILTLPVDITSGYSAQVINAGEIENSGVEIVLKTTPILSSTGFRWDFNVNYTRNRGKVVKLSDDLDVYQISSNYIQVLAKEGERMGDVYGTGFKTVAEGEYKGQVIHDENGFAIRDPELKNLGNYNPDFMVGFHNRFSFKGVDLSVLFDWRSGGVVNSRTVLIGGTSGMMDFTAEGREEGIISEGVIENADGSYKPNDVRLSGRDYYWWRYNRGNEEVGMYDASFVKLREARIGYTFPFSTKGTFPLRNFNISVVGRNLALWTENPHFDPESISFNGGAIVPGVEDMAMPTSRSIGFNIGFNF